MRIAIIAIVAAAIAIAGVSLFLYGGPFGHSGSIHVQGDTIYYNGGIDEPSYQKFSQIMEENPSVSKMVINSGGGDTQSGIKIGTLVYERGMDVKVEEICFSSCANYVFVSGSEKIIGKNSFVGWHGSESQTEVLAELDGVSNEEYLKSELRDALSEASPFWSEADVEREYQRVLSGLPAEAAFFDLIGLDKQVTLNGLEHIIEMGCVGWTHTIEDMQSYNIQNVSYEGEGTYPDPQILEQYGICRI